MALINFKSYKNLKADIDILCKQLENIALLQEPSGQRKNMPQIYDIEDFKSFLNENTIRFTVENEISHTIRPTQNQFNREKIFNIILNGSFKSSPIIISEDDYCIDGHHRYIAAKILNEKIKVLKVKIFAEGLIDFIIDNYDNYSSKSVKEDVC
jgi:hypothetical protein